MSASPAQTREDGYAVYKIREIAFGGGSRLSAEDGFLQFMIERLLTSDAPSGELPDEEEEETGDSMKLTSIQSITDFMNCAQEGHCRITSASGPGETLAVAQSHEVSAGGAAARAASPLHHDEYPLEE